MKKYVIVPIEKVSDEVIKAVEQTSLNTARKSLDGKLAVLSYEGDLPACLKGESELSAEQIQKQLTSATWGHDDLKIPGIQPTQTQVPAVSVAELSERLMERATWLAISVSAATALIVTGLGLLLHAHH